MMAMMMMVGRRKGDVDGIKIVFPSVTERKQRQNRYSYFNKPRCENEKK